MKIKPNFKTIIHRAAMTLVMLTLMSTSAWGQEYSVADMDHDDIYETLVIPVDILTGMLSTIFPATSLLFMLIIPCPVNITLFILDFNP